MASLKERLAAGITDYKAEKKRQTANEVTIMEEKARKFNAKAKTLEDKAKAKKALLNAENRLRRAKDKKSKTGKKSLSIFDFF